MSSRFSLSTGRLGKSTCPAHSGRPAIAAKSTTSTLIGRRDSVWLNAVADKKWIALTKDERIRYRPLELNALKSARLRAFIVICGNVRGVDTARILLKAMPKLLEIVSRQKGPFIYYVYKDSTVKRTR